METHNKLMRRMAAAGAKKICAAGNCSATYECGYSNHTPCGTSSSGSKFVCPLKKYGYGQNNAQKANSGHQNEEFPPSDMELWAICSLCPYAEVKATETGYQLIRKELHTFCSGCPVRHAEILNDEVQKKM